MKINKINHNNNNNKVKLKNLLNLDINIVITLKVVPINFIIEKNFVMFASILM